MNRILIRPEKAETLFDKKLCEAQNNKTSIYANLKKSVEEMTEKEHFSYEIEAEDLNDLEVID